ncbi:unnamed protein product [Paramecium pentaurelia]|uniref:Uncharacterized protein n=1 Tax=Paramecium pentaurelia TaxID=43138 RepID=A0A8S1XWC5_9CILI|nr:unnamed protein product [Paramecium pentaurelia]
MNQSQKNNNQFEKNIEIEIPNPSKSQQNNSLQNQLQNSQQDQEQIQFLQSCIRQLLLQPDYKQIDKDDDFFERVKQQISDFQNIKNKSDFINQLKQEISNRRKQQNLKEVQQQKNYEKKIEKLKHHLKNLKEKYQELYLQLSQYKDKNYNLVMELKTQQDQFQENTILQQIENMSKNSIKIEVDVAQFKENIQKLNTQRQQTIDKMKNLLKEFQSTNKQSKTKQVNNINEQGIQNIINLIKDSTKSISNMEQSIDSYKKELKQMQQNKNNKDYNLMEKLIQQFQNNQNCFIHVRQIFEKILTILMLFGSLNQNLYKHTQELEKQLLSLYHKNNEFEKQIELLLKELNEQDQENNDIIEKATYPQSSRLGIQSTNYQPKFYNQFIDQIRVNIENMVRINLQFFFDWNFNNNFQIANSQLLESTKSFNISLQEPNRQIEIDSMENQLKKSLGFVQQIYSQYPKQTVVNQYNQQSLQSLLKILQTIQNYKKEIETHKQTNQNTY